MIKLLFPQSNCNVKCCRISMLSHIASYNILTSDDEISHHLIFQSLFSSGQDVCWHQNNITFIIQGWQHFRSFDNLPNNLLQRQDMYFALECLLVAQKSMQPIPFVPITCQAHNIGVQVSPFLLRQKTFVYRILTSKTPNNQCSTLSRVMMLALLDLNPILGHFEVSFQLIQNMLILVQEIPNSQHLCVFNGQINQ